MNLPPYPIFPVLSDDSIRLREINNIDLKNLVEISFYDAVQAINVTDAAEMHERIITDYKNGNSLHWGIAEIRTDQILGTCGFYRGFEGEKGEIGCILLPQFQGNGYMNSALKLAIDFGLNQIKLKKIWAETDVKNKKAVRLLENLNFIKIAASADGEIKYEFKNDKN